MSQATLDKDTLPWYRQGWPWFLIALPASAVVAGILTLVIAIRTPHALVVDDYYKEGLAINQEKHRLDLAKAMKLSALLRVSGDRAAVTLQSIQPVTDATLTLKIIHATRPELDTNALLKRNADGSYGAPLKALRTGNWYLRLEDPKKTWEIRSRMRIEGPFQTYLTPEKD